MAAAAVAAYNPNAEITPEEAKARRLQALDNLQKISRRFDDRSLFLEVDNELIELAKTVITELHAHKADLFARHEYIIPFLSKLSDKDHKGDKQTPELTLRLLNLILDFFKEHKGKQTVTTPNLIKKLELALPKPPAEQFTKPYDPTPGRGIKGPPRGPFGYRGGRHRCAATRKRLQRKRKATRRR